MDGAVVPGDSLYQTGAALTAESRGYWFERHGKITICWRADGSVVTMDLA